MATAGCFGSNERQTLDDCYARTVDEIHNHRKYTSFWRFLAGLTGELLSDKPEATLSGWGWSNFLKIGHCTEKKPPKEMVELEADACRQSLAAEIAAIKNSLIFVASADDFGMMDVISGSACNWQKSYEDDGIWYQMVAHENLLMHGYHPNFAYLDGFFDQMLNRTTELARKHLPGLARRRPTKSPIGAA
jgi:hypothetical protein